MEITQITAELREHLVEAKATAEAKKAEWEEAKHNAERIERAVKALDPTPAKAGRPPGTKNGHGKAPARPSQDSLDHVMDVIVGHFRDDADLQSLSLDGIVDIADVSRDTVRRSVHYLREENRIRIAGTSESGATLFAPMPEELFKNNGSS